MRDGWQVKSLGEILVRTETVDPTRSPNKEFVYIDVSSVSNQNLSIQEVQRLKGADAPSRARKQVRANDVLFATIRPTLRRIAIVPSELDGEVCSTGYFVFRPKPEVDPRFVYYFLQTAEFMSAMESLQKGASYPAVTDGDVRSQSLAFPSLAEQQRIVAILDEAFHGIATAQANAESSLRGSTELLGSYLRFLFAESGDGWIDTTIGDQLTLQRGFDITKGQQRDGDIPVVSSGGIKSYHDLAMAKAPGVVIGRKGTLGKCFFLEQDYWPHDTTLWVKDFKGNEPRFIYYFLLGLEVKHLDSGAANPALNRNQIHPIKIAWPPVLIQRELVRRLDSLSEDAWRLASLYEKKLSALDDLKKSLLHHAFSGQL